MSVLLFVFLFVKASFISYIFFPTLYSLRLRYCVILWVGKASDRALGTGNHYTKLEQPLSAIAS